MPQNSLEYSLFTCTVYGRGRVHVRRGWREECRAPSTVDQFRSFPVFQRSCHPSRRSFPRAADCWRNNPSLLFPLLQARQMFEASRCCSTKYDCIAIEFCIMHLNRSQITPHAVGKTNYEESSVMATTVPYQSQCRSQRGKSLYCVNVIVTNI